MALKISAACSSRRWPMSLQRATLAALDEVRVRLLGKKGLLTEQLKGLGKLPAAERPAAGQRINDAKAAIQTAIEARRERLEAGSARRRSSRAAPSM